MLILQRPGLGIHYPYLLIYAPPRQPLAGSSIHRQEQPPHVRGEIRSQSPLGHGGRRSKIKRHRGLASFRHPLSASLALVALRVHNEPDVISLLRTLAPSSLDKKWRSCAALETPLIRLDSSNPFGLAADRAFVGLNE